MVIDISVTSIEEYMHQFLSWLPMKSDEELLLLLHRILHESREQRPLREIPLREVDLLSTPMFAHLDREQQQAIINGLEVP